MAIPTDLDLRNSASILAVSGLVHVCIARDMHPRMIYMDNLLSAWVYRLHDST